MESTEHLILLCDWAKLVWFCCPFSFRFDEQNVSRIEAWWFDLFTSNHLEEYDLALIAAMCWFLRKGRCSQVFENVKPNPLLVVSKASALVAEFWEANGFTFMDKNEPMGADGSFWVPPSVNSFKANSDGAFDHSGVGVIFRDRKGELIEYVSCVAPAKFAFAAEALALKKAMQMAFDLGLEHISFESDCDLLVDVVNSSKNAPDWQSEATLLDIQVLRRKFDLLDQKILKHGCRLASSLRSKGGVSFRLGLRSPIPSSFHY